MAGRDVVALFFVRSSESRELTRRDLLDAAALGIAEKGLAASSNEDIVAHAGYTHGAFYSKFRSASELFVELLRVKYRDIQGNRETLLRDVAVSSETVQQQFALLYARCQSSTVDYVVWAESRLPAERDVYLREHVRLCVSNDAT
ncbi:MAG: TetR/AcrR family transcriptional regulator [Burkholderia contaminans]|uniref:TetR/AcrR family transcriptional regulator n=1 Tax=Bacteria TaxID=2 RepID=UPI000CFEB1A7|nr:MULTISPECIES: TetR/AcrR family transcriptional regulator [Burkholderia]MBD1410803.1 TetR/AcrR family transcriptional regulator [Burkholderia contaminans]MBH9669506.1 TetR/AcrR family transcriptional regulator [Burkholderia contaminans]MBH9676489.1 TetR/AcrR family transcriptional regulator [Burkholderia contaminans]MBH9706913.1 TetR/AcrR family transcriptional regulator [Burkholderia contaminans]MBM6426037.1 TetR/AcrR family transcriptional regulator [Burkholderia contaminans]